MAVCSSSASHESDVNVTTNGTAEARKTIKKSNDFTSIINLSHSLDLDLNDQKTRPNVDGNFSSYVFRRSGYG